MGRTRGRRRGGVEKEAGRLTSIYAPHPGTMMAEHATSDWHWPSRRVEGSEVLACLLAPHNLSCRKTKKLRDPLHRVIRDMYR